jgi:hypothetical protein
VVFSRNRSGGCFHVTARGGSFQTMASVWTMWVIRRTICVGAECLCHGSDSENRQGKYRRWEVGRGRVVLSLPVLAWLLKHMSHPVLAVPCQSIWVGAVMGLLDTTLDPVWCRRFLKGSAGSLFCCGPPIAPV